MVIRHYTVVNRGGHVLQLQRGNNGCYGVWDAYTQSWAITPYEVNGGRTLPNGCSEISTHAGRICITDCIRWMDKQR